MLTVTQLARQFDISRSTILYYEREQLLTPAFRSDNGYRWYGQEQIEKLETIMAYRSLGVPIANFSAIIRRKDKALNERILLDQFTALDKEIQKLRRQQKAIVQIIEKPTILEESMVTKQRWVEIMRASGLNDDDMENWHKQFEKMEPDSHQEFLESLGIDESEIKKIRDWSASSTAMD